MKEYKHKPTGDKVWAIRLAQEINLFWRGNISDVGEPGDWMVVTDTGKIYFYPNRSFATFYTELTGDPIEVAA